MPNHPDQRGLPVTVAINWQNHFGRQAVMGVMRYAAENDTGWSVDLLTRPDQVPLAVRQRNSVGIIAAVMDERTLRALRRLRLPVVATIVNLPGWNLPCVDADNEAVGRVAADHFLDRGYRHFAVFESAYLWGIERARGFREQLAAKGFSCHTLTASPQPHAHKVVRMYMAGADRLGSALARLPKPLALFGTNDGFARGLVQSCQTQGLNVPEEVAVLGVDDDPLPCLMDRPWLSSIVVPFDQIGYQAARTLDRLLAGKPVESMVRIAPLNVVLRHSTSALAVDDPDAVAAIRFIHDHAATGVTPDQVVSALAVSRRTLERRFRAALGRTLMDEIHRVQIERARELLAASDLRTAAIAERCGFRNASRLSIVFHRLMGITPREYRKRSRPAGIPSWPQ